MPLAAAQIIDAIAARMTGLPLAGARVFTSRAWPLAEDALPAWRVLAENEDIEPTTVHPNARQEHRLQVELHGYARAVNDLDDALHALTAQALESVFSLTPPADALAALRPKLQMTQRRIERRLEADGQAVLGEVVITLRVVFSTRVSEPQSLV